MDKQLLLNVIRDKLASGELTLSDLSSVTQQPAVAAMPPAAPISTNPRPESPAGTVRVSDTAVSRMNVSKTFYYIGGLIVLIGIGVFVSQFWSQIGSFGHELVSLGSAILAYIIGAIVSRTDPESELGAAFHLIAGVLFPLGLYTILNESHIPVTADTWIFIFAALTILYTATMMVIDYPLITFFVIVYATAFLFTVVQHFLQGTGMQYALIPQWYNYFSIVMGASYLYLGWQFTTTRNRSLNRILFFVGSLWVLVGAYQLENSLPGWIVIYPVLIAGMVALSLYVRNMTILILSSLSILAYVGYLTANYFANSMGWPFALIIAGLIFITTGYFTFYLRRNYMMS